MREKEIEVRTGSIGFGSLLFGAAVGAILGVLFAPAKGQETREKVSDWLKTQKEKGFRAKEQMYQGAKKAYREGKEELVP